MYYIAENINSWGIGHPLVAHIIRAKVGARKGKVTNIQPTFCTSNPTKAKVAVHAQSHPIFIPP